MLSKVRRMWTMRSSLAMLPLSSFMRTSCWVQLWMACKTWDLWSEPSVHEWQAGESGWLWNESKTSNVQVASGEAVPLVTGAARCGRQTSGADRCCSFIHWWMFGALLRRELLSIPHSAVRFFTSWMSFRAKLCDGGSLLDAKWCVWLQFVICYMSCHVGCRWSPCFFLPRMQWDRMNLIMGGLESVPQLLNQVSFRRCWHTGRPRASLTVARLDEVGGASSHRLLRSTVPSTLLPDHFFFEQIWSVVESGRWRYMVISDHITIGESRAVVRLLRIAPWPQLHAWSCLGLLAGQLTYGMLDDKGQSYLDTPKSAAAKSSCLLGSWVACFLALGWEPVQGCNGHSSSLFYICIYISLSLFSRS